MSNTLEILKEIQGLVTENFEPNFIEPTFTQGTHPTQSVSILAGFNSISLLNNERVIPNHNLTEGFLSAIPAPMEAVVLNLITITLGKLGVKLHYGVAGLIYVYKELAKFGMDFCPPQTGPLLADSNSSIIDKSEALILSIPISQNDESRRLMFTLARKTPETIVIDAYRPPPLYHDTKVIAQVLG